MYGPTREAGLELIDMGITIHNLDALPRTLFRVETLPYIVSRVYRFTHLHTVYVIPLRFASDCPSGTIISGWSFQLPRHYHEIEWGWDPKGIIPTEHWDVYKDLFKSPMMDVLNGRRRIQFGKVVEGAICGVSPEPIGEYSFGGIRAELRLIDTLGNAVWLDIDLTVDRLRHSSARRLGGRPRQRLFEKPDDAGGRFDPCTIPANPGSEPESLRGDAELGIARPSLSQ